MAKSLTILILITTLNLITFLPNPAVSFSPDNPTDRKILILLDDLSLKSSHSLFFATLQSRGFSLDFKLSDDPSISVKRYGQYLYDSLILFSPSADRFGGSLDLEGVLDFVDSGHDLILAADSNASDLIRNVAAECGVDFDEDTSSMVIDHTGYAVSEIEGDHTLIASDGFIQSDVILGSSKIEAPVLFKGIVHSLNPQNSLVLKVLSASSSAYSSNPTSKLSSPPSLTGTDISLVSVVQARNNARIMISGSLDMFSNRLFRSDVQKSGTLKKSRKIFGISLSLIIINMAAIMERADENLLPAVYKEVSEAFSAGPSDLGYLTFVRNFIQGLASPVAGILAMNYDRPTILSIGILCWALSTAAVGASKYFFQVALWRAINGFGLAIVIPALQSFIADSYLDGVRGAGFGFLNLVGTVGGIGGGAIATVMAGTDFWGIPGWRCAFVMMATLSCLIGFLVFQFVIDPRKLSSDTDTIKADDRENLIEKSRTSSATVWWESWTAMKAVMKVPTFQFIVLQGLVGSVPWTAIVFITYWFELIGFDHNSAATLVSLFAAGCALGSFFGGVIADKMSQKYPHSGRIMCAQFSAFMGIPFTLFLLRVIPQNTSSYHTYATILFLMGLTISWCATATNGPMFAEVVPMKHRTMIYAFDRAFEVSFSSFAAPIVGILSEKIYGYDAKSIDPILGSAGAALALSRGLLAMMVVPFGLCSLFYTPLYWTFKQDKESAKIGSLKETEML